MAINDSTLAPTPLEADSTDRLLIDIVKIVTTTSPTVSGSQIDGNAEHVSLAVTDNANLTETPLIADNRNNYLYIDLLIE